MKTQKNLAVGNPMVGAFPFGSTAIKESQKEGISTSPRNNKTPQKDNYPTPKFNREMAAVAAGKPCTIL
ncbi:hypothetical protein L3V79_05615 [Thiotrichales bacterium 19S9-12]|nr:hypothetical protein [Thiotrichales bacterium 19S9-11]MCF6811836.1 hypothetical protein [Thiotrichales bacterium 19S9-12]